MGGQRTWAWQTVPGGGNAGLNAIWPASASDVWAVGARGQILHGSPAGFTAVSTGTCNFFYAVWGTSPTDVWAGERGYGQLALHAETRHAISAVKSD